MDEIANSAMSARGSGAARFARVITEVSGPAILVVVGLVVVAARNAGHSAGAAWGGVAILLCAVVPMVYVARGVRAGKWSDHHVSRREQRAVPLLVAAVSITAAAVLLVVVHAPSELISLVLAQLAGLLIVLVVTTFWKVSVHAATAGGLLGVLTVLYGSWALLGAALVLLIGWSRTVLDAHSWPQVIVGAAIGFAVSVVLLPVL
jgi:membrane-associated phospholipid phosphatase